MSSQDFNAACDQFLQHGKIFKNFQPATIQGYRDIFSLFVKMTNITTVDELSTEMIETFLVEGRHSRGWSVCTFRTYLKRLRAFCNWLVKKKYISENYTDDIDKPPLEKRLPTYLSPEKCEALLETAYHLNYKHKTEGIRNRALIGMMILAGLRLSEVANLKYLDVDLDTHVITVRQGKCNKDRQVPISSRLHFFLSEYADLRFKRRSKHIHFFSSVARDEPLGARGIQNICKMLRVAAGIEFSPQILRHTFATHTYRGSRDIYAVSGLLGHAKIETTQIYAHLSLDDKRNSIEQHILNNEVNL